MNNIRFDDAAAKPTIELVPNGRSMMRGQGTSPRRKLIAVYVVDKGKPIASPVK